MLNPSDQVPNTCGEHQKGLPQEQHLSFHQRCSKCSGPKRLSAQCTILPWVCRKKKSSRRLSGLWWKRENYHPGCTFRHLCGGCYIVRYSKSSVSLNFEHPQSKPCFCVGSGSIHIGCLFLGGCLIWWADVFKENHPFRGWRHSFHAQKNKASFRSVDSSTVIIRPSATAWVTGAAGLQQVRNDSADDQLMTISSHPPSYLIYLLSRTQKNKSQGLTCCNTGGR